MWRKRQYELTFDARTALRHMLQTESILTCGDEGNARAVRNLMERSLRCQALRLVGRNELTREDLMTITRVDLEQAAAGPPETEGGRKP
jgi:stage V sporulation protein K